MNDLQLIKNRLLDENRLQDIYEAMGCEYISFTGNRIEAQLPSKYMSHNKRAVQTRLNNSLSSAIRTPVGFKGGDIFYLVSFLVNGITGDENNFRNDLPNAKRFICETLGWTEFMKDGTFLTKKDFVAPLKALMKQEVKRREYKPNPVLPESILDDFYIKGKPLPYQGWIDEGISYHTQVMYGVGFDLVSKRITLPLRNRFGQLVGVKGRIMKDEDDDRKYLYLYRCNNRYEWFNFYYAQPFILDQKRVYILESEKSIMKLFDNGIFNAIAIGASDISIEQADIIKDLGLDIEIVLCYDKGIGISEITNQAEIFKGRKIFAMYDIDNILEGKKSAPIDEGIEKWNNLVENYIFPINFEEE